MYSTFDGALLAAARPRDPATQPFVRQLQRGEVERLTLRDYGITLTALASGFPRVLCSVLAVCDHPEIRRSLIGNMLEEEGVVGFTPEQGVEIDAGRNHGALARRFALAAGATSEDLADPPGAERPWFAGALRAGNWIGALSYVAVGIEANVPPTFSLLIPPLREQYGFTEHDLGYFSEHLTADVRHGEEAAALIAEVAATPKLRSQALAGARRGGIAWWELHWRFSRRVRSLDS